MFLVFALQVFDPQRILLTLLDIAPYLSLKVVLPPTILGDVDHRHFAT